MNSWRKSIRFKMFLVTGGLFVSFSILIYASIYFFLPTFYYNYKTENMERELLNLAQSVEVALNENQFQEAGNLLDEFSATHNTELFMVDHNEQIVHISLPMIMQHSFGREAALRQLIPSNQINERAIVLRAQRAQLKQLKQPLTIFGNPYTIQGIMTLQPIDEAAHVILQFAPYVAIMIIIFATFAAFIYSKVATKPLLKMNQVAKRMSKLDFNAECVVNSHDEIGELAQNLNELSWNLQKTMSALTASNDQLTSELEYERHLEEKRREFVATISHELKSPITAVMGQIEAMIYKIGPYQDRDTYLKRSYEIMRTMDELVKEVLSLSQLEQHGFAPTLEAITLQAVVKKSLKKFEYFCQVKNINVELDLQATTVCVDKKLIEKAIGNVISNAINYSPDGASVKIVLKDRNLIVFNSGVTIAKTEQAQIFQAFYRIEKSRNRNTGGSGLGLHIVGKILDLHGIDYKIANVADGVEFAMKF